MTNLIYTLGNVGDVLFSKTAIIIYVSIFALLLIGVIFAFILRSVGGNTPSEIIINADNISANANAQKTNTTSSTLNAMPDVAPTGDDDEDDALELVPDDGKGLEGNEKRFVNLDMIDQNAKQYTSIEYDNKVSLKEICEDFRNFAAGEMKLYYSIDNIRQFIAGMAVSNIMILQGMSGTGKTSLANAFGTFIKNPSTVIPVQPMWKERTDLLGYYNEFTMTFNETQLLKKIYEANLSKSMYISILDEMNIARVEYYFAEFLSLLEIPDLSQRNLDVVASPWSNDPKLLKEGRIRIPDNMWFIGTANNDDSTFAISDKVYDRAMIMNLDSKSEPFTVQDWTHGSFTSDYFHKLVQEAQEDYSITKRSLNKLKLLDDYLIDNFHVTFGNRIMKQIRNYVAVYISCGGTELEALDDILTKKIIRKLEMQNPVYFRTKSGLLCEQLDDLFGLDTMKNCKDYIMKLARNA